jgi:hypothetical protein
MAGFFMRGRMGGMDEESKDLLRRLTNLQSEQNEILRKYLPPLWTRIRFSLLTLLILMTITSLGMGVIVYKFSSITAKTTMATPTFPPGAQVTIRPKLISDPPRQQVPQ